MKKHYLTLVLLFISVLSYAGIITVDNHTGSGANYSTISSAVSAATNGDTIYIQPSTSSYGGFTLNKGLVFIGPGHKPEFTGGVGVIITVISLANGSSNSQFIGLILNKIKCNVWQTSNNILIRNNFFKQYSSIGGAFGDASESSDWIIEGNVFIEAIGCGGCYVIDIKTGATGVTNSNWIIRNNFIQSKSSQDNSSIFMNLNATTVVENNIILHRNSSAIFNTDVVGGEFRNNIFWITQASFTDVSLDATNVVFSNNLTYHSNGSLIALSGDNNVDNSDPDFSTLDSDDPIWNYLNNYQLNSTSSGADAGEDGTDVGIYGGGYQFRMEGYPQNFPRFIDFDVLSNTVVPQGGSIEISINATRAGL
jgi:hypothetical protein